jgi:hypothetical protein
MGEFGGIWLNSAAVLWYVLIAIPAVAAISISVYAPKRA